MYYFRSKVYLADVDEYTGQMTQHIKSLYKNIIKVKAIIHMYNGSHLIDAEKFLYF